MRIFFTSEQAQLCSCFTPDAVAFCNSSYHTIGLRRRESCLVGYWQKSVFVRPHFFRKTGSWQNFLFSVPFYAIFSRKNGYFSCFAGSHKIYFSPVPRGHLTLHHSGVVALWSGCAPEWLHSSLQVQAAFQDSFTPKQQKVDRISPYPYN